MVASTEANSVQQAEGLFEMAREMHKQADDRGRCDPSGRTEREKGGASPDSSGEGPVYCPVTTTSRTRPFTVNDDSLELR